MNEYMRLEQKGPLLAGGVERNVDDFAKGFLADASEDVAQAGVDAIRQELHSVLKHPTGYYEKHIQTDTTKGDPVITDGGVIYGPWLEGVSSRNRTTRFKGYSTFRRVAQRLQEQAGEIAQKALPAHLGRLQ